MFRKVQNLKFIPQKFMKQHTFQNECSQISSSISLVNYNFQMEQQIYEQIVIRQPNVNANTMSEQQSNQWMRQKLQLESAKDFDNLLQIFSEFDTDNSGSISVNEWREAMKRFGHEATEQEAFQLLRQNNIQPDQELTLFEFIGLINRKKENMKGQQHYQLSKAFRLFDKDLDGAITAKQLKEGLQRFGETMSLEDLQLLVSIGDKDGDHTINFNEFCQIMSIK